MNRKAALDLQAFERLLAAAWVLQCQQDQKQRGIANQTAVPKPAVVSVPVLNIPVLSAPVPRTPPSNAPVLKMAAPVSEPPTLPIPLAAPLPVLAAVSNPVSVPTPSPAHSPLFKPIVARLKILAAGLRRPIRLVVPAFARGPFPDRRNAVATVEPLLVLILVLSFLLIQVLNNALARASSPKAMAAVATLEIAEPIASAITPPNVAASDKQPKPDPERRPAAVRPASPSAESPASSHGQVTDPRTAAALHDLSRFELHALQRRAEFGDDVAAFTLGMAYEVGRLVPRDCARAAKWVSAAANAGNAAAAYNLGLRYRTGDGVAANLEESARWLKKASTHRYQKTMLARAKVTKLGVSHGAAR